MSDPQSKNATQTNRLTELASQVTPADRQRRLERCAEELREENEANENGHPWQFFMQGTLGWLLRLFTR